VCVCVCVRVCVCACVCVCVFMYVWSYPPHAICVLGHAQISPFKHDGCPPHPHNTITQGSAVGHEGEQTGDAEPVEACAAAHVCVDRYMLRPAACGRPTRDFPNAQGNRPLGVFGHFKGNDGRNGSCQPADASEAKGTHTSIRTEIKVRDAEQTAAVGYRHRVSTITRRDLRLTCPLRDAPRQPKRPGRAVTPGVGNGDKTGKREQRDRP